MSKKEKIAWQSWLIQLTSSYIYQCVLRSTEGLYTSHLINFSYELEKHQYSCKHFSKVLFYHPTISVSCMKITFLLHVRFLRCMKCLFANQCLSSEHQRFPHKGAFNNYMERILPFFAALCGQFLYPERGQKQTFFDPLHLVHVVIEWLYPESTKLFSTLCSTKVITTHN